ncbi:DUF4351 domain-containing protein [Singulisphaera rosea]
MTTFDRGFQQGFQQGQRTLLRKQLEARFGPLNPGVIQLLDDLGPEKLESLAVAILTAESFHELNFKT